MPTVNFTDRFIKNIKATGKREDFRDDGFSGGDFGLRVTPAGHKSFFLRYLANGKHRRINLGTYPVIGLSDARRNALILLRETADGLDPQAERQRKMRAETVGELFAVYFSFKEGKISPFTLRAFKDMYRREIEKELAFVKAEAIRKRHVVPILEAIASRANTMSNRVRELILAVFNHAVSRGLLETHALYGLPKFGKDTIGERYLSKDEIQRYLKHVDLLPPVERAYFLLLLFLGMRAGELSRLQWSFIDGDMLVIPSTHQKNKKVLRIPIVARLQKELTLLKDITGDTNYMFPSPDGTKPRQAFYKFHRRLVRLMESPYFELRDLRRTVETHMRQIGCAGDVVALLLGHNTTGLRRHYDKGEYLPQKKAILTKWISWLDSLAKEDQKVVNLF